MIDRRKPADPDRARRATNRAAYREEMDTLQGRPPPPPKPAGRGGRKAERLVSTRALVSLHKQGVDVGIGGVVSSAGRHVGVLAPAHSGRRAPLQVHLQPYVILGQPKPHRLVAPTVLAIVRMMPCSLCDKGRPFYEQLQLCRSQSEVNHHPARGPAAGGSDLEVHPVCGPSPGGCHGAVTEHRADSKGVPITDERLDLAVARTLHMLVRAIRDGRLDSAALLAAGVEAVVGE